MRQPSPTTCLNYRPSKTEAWGENLERHCSLEKEQCFQWKVLEIHMFSLYNVFVVYEERGCQGWAGQNSQLLVLLTHKIIAPHKAWFSSMFLCKTPSLADDRNVYHISMWHSSHSSLKQSVQAKPSVTEVYLKRSSPSTWGSSSSGCWALFCKVSVCLAVGAGAMEICSGQWASGLLCSNPLHSWSTFSRSSMWLTELVSLTASEPLRALLKGFWPGSLCLL